MYSLEMFLVPYWWWYTVAFGFGVIIGSFLNVYIYRFHTGKSLAGSSHCLSCGRDLKWYELIPLFSYLGLCGRCRTCGSRIPARYFWVELSTGVLFVLSVWLTTDIFKILLLWLIVSVLVVITVYDLYHFIIPDKPIIVLAVLAFVYLAYNHYLYPYKNNLFIYEVATALAGAAFFFVLWFMSKGKWLGFGDVKLAFPLGLLVGPVYVFSFVVLSFWIGSVISLFLLYWPKLRWGKYPLRLTSTTLTMKSAVPFAPFLVASCLVVLFFRLNVLDLFHF